MQPHDRIRIKHILDACQEIMGFTKALDNEGFKRDRKLQLSVIQLIEVIGEASNNLSEEVIGSTNEVPWTDIIGMRNRMIHAYHDIDLDLVWNTAIHEVPELYNTLMVKYEKEL